MIVLRQVSAQKYEWLWMPIEEREPLELKAPRGESSGGDTSWGESF